MKNGRTNPTPKISDENDDDEPYVAGLKDGLLQHLADYDYYLDSRSILDPLLLLFQVPFFFYFFNIYFWQKLTHYEEIVLRAAYQVWSTVDQ